MKSWRWSSSSFRRAAALPPVSHLISPEAELPTEPASLDEFFQFGELDNSIETSLNLFSGQPKHCAVEIDIIPPGKFWMEAGSHFKEASKPTIRSDRTGRRLSNAREYLEEGRLAGSVVSNARQRLPLINVERNVLESPKIVFRRVNRDTLPIAEACHQRLCALGHLFEKRCLIAFHRRRTVLKYSLLQ
jgi:hypothetical protein